MDTLFRNGENALQIRKIPQRRTRQQTTIGCLPACKIGEGYGQESLKIITKCVHRSQSKIMRCVGHVACTIQKYVIHFTGKASTKRPLWRPQAGWKNNF